MDEATEPVSSIYDSSTTAVHPAPGPHRKESAVASFVSPAQAEAATATAAAAAETATTTATTDPS